MGPCGQFIDRMAFQIEPFYQYQQATFPTGSWPDPGRKARIAVTGWQKESARVAAMNMPSMSSASSGTPASARRQEASLDLPVDPPRDGESKQAWVYRQIRERVLKGALPSGARLPSTRSLAQRWRIARSTVEAAYDQLRGEGYGRHGRVGHMWRPSFQTTSSARDCQERAGRLGRGCQGQDGQGRARPAVSRPGGRRARCRMSSR